jgi:hypothetical protein
VSSFKNDSLVLEFRLPLPLPRRKKSTTYPKTSPYQDFLITNAMTQVQIP